MIIIPDNSASKVLLVDFLFKFETSKVNDEKTVGLKNIDFVKNIEKKVIYSFIPHYKDIRNEYANSVINNKNPIIMKYNTTSNCCAIVINSPYTYQSTLMFFMTETYRTSTYKLYDLCTKLKRLNNLEEGKFQQWVEVCIVI